MVVHVAVFVFGCEGRRDAGCGGVLALVVVGLSLCEV